MTEQGERDGDSGARGGAATVANTADTVPPPAGGDAYSAATEVREAPADLLDIMRQVKEARSAKVPSELVEEAPAPSGPPLPLPMDTPAPEPPSALPRVGAELDARSRALVTVLVIVALALFAGILGLLAGSGLRNP